MSRVFIKLRDKETNIISNKIPIENLIFAQDDIEFDFETEDGSYNTLPYKDFLFFQEDYEVIVNIKDKDDKESEEI